jgi:hypothetical protein
MAALQHLAAEDGSHAESETNEADAIHGCG